MRALCRTVAAVALVLLVGSSGALARPTPVLTPPLGSHYELVKERKASSEKTSTKAWLKTKKNQTVAWMKRQKRKVKSLVD